MSLFKTHKNSSLSIINRAFRGLTTAALILLLTTGTMPYSVLAAGTDIPNSPGGIPDTALYNAILSEWDTNGDGVLSTTEALLADSLSMGGMGVESLKGISYLPNLTSINAFSNTIRDLHELSALSKLTYLNISGNYIESLAGLKAVTGLEELIAADNRLRDLNGLENMTKLRILNVSSNFIYDLEALTNVTELTHLYAEYNSIQSAKGLSKQKSLTYLDLSNNYIDDIAELNDKTSLTILNLNYNLLNDISPVCGLINLKELYLMDNHLSSRLPDMSKLTSLAYLDVSSNMLDNLSGIKTLTGLENLYAADTYIENVADIRNLTGLTWLDLSSNYIEDISGLQNIKKLSGLQIGYNYLKDLNGIEKLTELTYLEAPYNAVADITPVLSLSKLDSLDLSYNEISDVSGIERITGLYSLNLLGNDLKSLPNLTALPLIYADFRLNYLPPAELSTKLPQNIISNQEWLKKQNDEQCMILTDESTGIKVESLVYLLKGNVEFHAQKIESGSKYQQAKDAMYMTKFQLYDISFTKDGKAFFPDISEEDEYAENMKYVAVLFPNSGGFEKLINYSFTFEGNQALLCGAGYGEEYAAAFIEQNGLLALSYVNPLHGDTNGDGQLDITDMMVTRNAILGTATNPATVYRADSNYDNNLDITDIMTVRNIILGTTLPPFWGF